MKKQGWQLLFSEFIQERSARPFVWGEQDCCLFAADWVTIATNVDHMEGYRGAYKNAMEALRLINDGGGLEALLDSKLERLTSPAFADVGDVVLVDNDGRHALGVCNGITTFVPGETGLLNMSTFTALAAWRI